MKTNPNSPKHFSVRAWRLDPTKVSYEQETDDPQPIARTLWNDGFSGEVTHLKSGLKITLHELALMPGSFNTNEPNV